MNDSTEALGAVLLRISRDFAELAALVNGGVDPLSQETRQARALLDFPSSPALGLTRAEASAVFRRHGLNPRSIGAFVNYGYLAREGDRRWLTARGRVHAELRAGLEERT